MRRSELIKKNYIAFWVCMAVSIVSPLILLGSSFKPETESYGQWIQRSGSIMVVFALVAEIYVIKISNLLNLSGDSDQEIQELPSLYKMSEVAYSSAVFVVVACGTFIWGYGDLLF